MKKIEDFEGLTVHGLIADDDFICWVKHPDAELDRQWTAISNQDDASARVVAEAKAIVQAVNVRVDQPPALARRRVFERIKSDISVVESEPVVRRFWSSTLFQVAAGFILVSVVGLWLYFDSPGISVPGDHLALDVSRGVIYLNDGRTLSFEDLVLGVPSEFDGGKLTMERGNRLVYETNGSAGGSAFVSGIKSPASAVLEVALPDGSMASLNAQSTLRFSADNFDEQRHLSLDGEGYFVVHHDAERPFTVAVGQIDVTVLGTQFVVSGYENAASVDVALVDGSVQVKHPDGAATTIVPGQQARFDDGQVNPQVTNADLDQVLAWKNGLFSFKNKSIDEVMQVLSHWYGITIDYEGTKPTKEITGTIPNESTLEDVLAILTDTGIDAQLSLRGNTIVVRGE